MIFKVVEPELLYKAEACTGEGAIWHFERNSLFWVDIEGKMLYEYFPINRKCSYWKFDKMVTTVVPETKDTVVVALQDEIIRFNLKNNNIDSIAFIEVKNGILRCNDGKCDLQGRLWIGTMDFNGLQKSASLYTILQDGTLKTQLDGICISNGIGWSSNGKYMYYIDTPTQKVIRYFYDESHANLRLDRVIIQVPEDNGSPDGMTIDENGNLWIAQWNGFGVYCYNSETGELLSKVKLPVPNVTSCAFGGENLDILYITSARSGLSEYELETYPLSGSLFSCKPGVRGIKSNNFKRRD